MDRLDGITLKPSRLAYRLHLAVLLLAMTALFLCDMWWLIKMALAASVLVTGAGFLHTQPQITVEKIGFEQEQWWAVIRGNKTMVTVIDEQLVLPWLIVINLRVLDGQQKYSLALWSDTAEQEDLRRLRVFLRHR